tara:strand:- start:31091 stop:32284 length:1194 start_codon:yes stop_codon:yes gene_type:complete
MKKIIYLSLISFCLTVNMFSQIHHNIQDNAVSNVAERIAKFSVADAPKDLLEIVNSTQHNNKFKPDIWVHRESDNRNVFRIFTTLNSNIDNGNFAVMNFRAEVRNTIYDSYPFPWGTHFSEVQNRPLFAWKNSNSTKMLMKANGNLGLGTTNPTAQLHTTSTLRFQNLPNATTPTYILGTDASGNVKEYPANTGGGSSDSDWFKVGGGTPNSISDNIFTHGKVGVNNSSPTAYLHVSGSVRMDKLPLSKFNPTYLLGVDAKGNVTRHSQIVIILKEMKETIEKQQNQITLLQNKISSLKTDSSTNLLDSNKLTSFSTNFPNPFSLTTTIDYTILRDVNEAKIIIYNANGSNIKTYNLKERESKGKLTIRKEGMKPGVYYYTLITDGIIIGTKKMIVK